MHTYSLYIMTSRGNKLYFNPWPFSVYLQAESRIYLGYRKEVRQGQYVEDVIVTASMSVMWRFFDLRLDKRLSKQSWGWWFETLLRPLWRHCNGVFWFDFSLVQNVQTIMHKCWRATIFVVVSYLKNSSYLMETTWNNMDTWIARILK